MSVLPVGATSPSRKRRQQRLHDQMRLQPNEAAAIREAVLRHFGADAEAWLFGSRVDDTRRGGDIDLYVETGIESDADIVRRQIELMGDLYLRLGEQKIDVVIKSRHHGKELPIHRVARETGIRL